MRIFSDLGKHILHPNLLTDERLEKHPSAYHIIESFLYEEIIDCNIESYNLKEFPLFNDGF